MATQPKKPQAKKSAAGKAEAAKKPAAKKPARKKVVSAKANGPAVRRKASPAEASMGAAPVLVNAVKPDEILPDTALVDRAVDSLEQSLKAALPAAAAVNRKLVDIAQTNMNSGMELARDLAGAKSPLEMMQLGMSYWHEHMGVFEAQAQELRTLSAEFMTTASEPIRAHIRRA